MLLLGTFFSIYTRALYFCHSPVSILYGIAMLLLPTHISNLAVSTEQFLLKHTELILTISR